MALPADTAQLIHELREHVEANPDFHALLVASLEKADKAAKSELDAALYAALSWPNDLEGYYQFLEAFALWRPQQDAIPAWKIPEKAGYQEVYDRLCHFYWLIDQPVGEKGRIAQNNPWFSAWLVKYANAWGSFLDTPASFNDDILQSFINDSPEYAVGDSMIDDRPNAPSGWLTFNQFFARELNPGLRPIDSPFDNTVVVSPADCTFKAIYDIAEDSSIPGITIKGTHPYTSIHELLGDSPYRDAFAGGMFAHYFLGPYSYHRFHAPVAGRVKECRAVRGRVFLDVQLTDGQFDAPDSSEGAYEFFQQRGIIIIDTAGSPYGDVGLVAAIPVGMAQVSSVNMTATKDRDLLKGDEFGYFLFGGSDTIVLFQKKARAQIDTGTDYRHYGTPIARCSKA